MKTINKKLKILFYATSGRLTNGEASIWCWYSDGRSPTILNPGSSNCYCLLHLVHLRSSGQGWHRFGAKIPRGELEKSPYSGGLTIPGVSGVGRNRASLKYGHFYDYRGYIKQIALMRNSVGESNEGLPGWTAAVTRNGVISSTLIVNVFTSQNGRSTWTT